MTESPENSDSAFVSDETSTEHVRFLGAVITIVADADATDGALTVTEIDAPPGYENDLHTYRPSELFYVLSGEMTLHVNGEAYVLQPGTTGIVPSAAPHGFRVTGGIRFAFSRYSSLPGGRSSSERPESRSTAERSA